jgi:hypothetical protein
VNGSGVGGVTPDATTDPVVGVVVVVVGVVVAVGVVVGVVARRAPADDMLTPGPMCLAASTFHAPCSSHVPLSGNGLVWNQGSA